MIDIVKTIGKFGAECRCSRCGAMYQIKNKYGAAKSPIGDLCSECKSSISSMVTPTQEQLLKAFNYDESTGALTHLLSTSSGLQGEIATFAHSRGYLSVCIGKKQLLAHRVIYLMKTGQWPSEHIDHINHIKHDNRWENLREVEQETNNRNMPNQANNTSGVLGVSLHKPTGKYRAYISVKGKAKHLGLFGSVEAATAAREDANALYRYHDNHGR